MSKKPVIIGIILTGVVVMSILSAGCIGAFSYCPDEVKVHNNIIAVQESSVGEETIRTLLLSPNDYESSLISAIDTYLPKKNAVLEIGSKFGVVTAYIDDQIYQNVAHVAVEPNPEHFELLKKTLDSNEITLKPMNVYVKYSLDNADTAEYTYTTDYASGLFDSGGYQKTVTLPVATVSDLVDTLDVFHEFTNISLVIDDDSVSSTIFSYEPNLTSSIEYIIMNVKDSSLVKGIIKTASICGYTNINYPTEGSDGYTVLVFKRMVDPNNTDTAKDAAVAAAVTDAVSEIAKNDSATLNKEA